MNILHILCDQLRADVIGALGNSHIHTPNIDRLVHMGVSFTNAYSPSPVCVSARCSMIMGKYPMATKCYANDDMPDTPTFMDQLTKKGYLTHGIGKCHFKPDTAAMRGFKSRERQEECQIIDEANEPYYSLLKERGYNHCYEPHGSRSEMYYVPQISKMPQELHPTQWIGDRTVDFIENHSGDDNPWYLFSSFIHPHPPFAPPVPWNTMYRTADMPAPFRPYNYQHLQCFVNKIQNRYKYRDNGWDENLVLTMRAYYYACVSFVDMQVGRILDALEASGQLDNTTILFTADHGELLGDFGCFGKRSMHDASARIPFIIYEKGTFEGGEVSTLPVSLVDLAPTFLDCSEGHDYDGVNLRNLYRGNTHRKYVYSFYSAYEDASYAGVKVPSLRSRELMTNMMITDGNYKYIYSVPDQQELLFKNRDESMNLAGISSEEHHTERLKKRLMSYLREQNEDFYMDDHKWREFSFTPSLPTNPRAGLVRQDHFIPWFKNKEDAIC